MNFQTLHKQRKFILVLAAIGAISVFLPWFTVSAEGLGVRISESQNGFRGTGVLVFLAFMVAAVLALLGHQAQNMDKTMWMATLCVGAIALLFVVVNLAKTPNSGDGFGFAQAGPGFGIWISLVASVGTLAAAWVLRNPGDSLNG
jgi:Na+/pantothenate symporter